MAVKDKNNDLKKVENDKINIVVKNKRRIIPIILLLVLILIGITIITNKKGDIYKITSKSSLQKIIEINELSTVKYSYNAIARKYNGKEEKADNIEYYVKYEGFVNAGIDFNEVDIKVDDKNKKITITLPDVEIHDTSVDIGSLKYIFVTKKKEEDSISQEAYKLCKSDLKNRAEKEDELKNIAKQNAISALKGILDPWLDSLNEEYELEFK